LAGEGIEDFAQLRGVPLWSPAPSPWATWHHSVVLMMVMMVMMMMVMVMMMMMVMVVVMMMVMVVVMMMVMIMMMMMMMATINPQPPLPTHVTIVQRFTGCVLR
jgi:hypothetical protein